MSAWDLPTTVEVGGKQVDIRSDYRVILDVMQALAAPELDEQERALVALSCFFPAFDPYDCEWSKEELDEACERMVWFVNGGGNSAKDKRKRPRLMDWEQDFPLIVAPVNRVAGCEVRALPYLHWWTFLGYYQEIGGDCTFAQVVGIRSRRAKGQKLDKSDQAYYREHRDLIDLRREATEEEQSIIKEWTQRPNAQT